MNIDFKKYIDELPMSKMIQIHICKPYISKNDLLTNIIHQIKMILSRLKKFLKNIKNQNISQ